jgi:Mg2+/citrate symporter
MTLKVLINLLSLFVCGLLVGNELAVVVLIHPVIYSVSDEAHVRVAKPLTRRLGHPMPFWYALSLIFAILQMLIVRATPAARWLSCAAAILLALNYCSHDSLAGSN